MKVLVTGGAGYVGSHAVRELKKAGHEPTIFDSLMRGNRWVLQRLKVPFVEGDLCDETEIHRTLKKGKFDAVMHFGAVALVGESVRDPGLYYWVNVTGGLSLLNAMRSTGCKRLIFSSTAAVYGEPAVMPISESCHTSPVNPYGHSKLAFEQMVLAYRRAYGFKTLALRYFNAAGADEKGDIGECHSPETHLIPNVLFCAAGKRKSVMVFGSDYDTPDGTCLRDFIHVTDLARLHVLALEHLDGLEVPALNVGTGTASSVMDVIEAARKVTGQKIPVTNAPRRAGDPPALVARPSLAEETLGFRAERKVEDMVSSAWKFMRKNPKFFLGGDRLRFGEAAVKAGLVEGKHVLKALDEQQRRIQAKESPTLLGLIMLDMGLLESPQLMTVLRMMNEKPE